MAANLTSFFLQMTSRPDIQQCAQQELDRVCPNRLATLADRDHLPYVESVIMELCRYHPALPSGVPHRSEKEDTFEGKRIPAGSIMLCNVWYDGFLAGYSQETHIEGP